LLAPLKPGDGVVFDAGDRRERGRWPGVHNGTTRAGDTAGIRARRLEYDRIHTGDRLWKTSDPELDKRLRQTFAGDKIRHQRPIAMEVHGVGGGVMTLIARDEERHVTRAESTMPLAPAEKHH